MFDDVITKINCPYCGTANEIILTHIGFGRTVKVKQCCAGDCKKYFVADMDVSLSGTARKIEGL